LPPKKPVPSVPVEAFPVVLGSAGALHDAPPNIASPAPELQLESVLQPEPPPVVEPERPVFSLAEPPPVVQPERPVFVQPEPPPVVHPERPVSMQAEPPPVAQTAPPRVVQPEARAFVESAQVVQSARQSASCSGDSGEASPSSPSAMSTPPALAAHAAARGSRTRRVFVLATVAVLLVAGAALGVKALRHAKPRPSNTAVTSAV
jgi:hypothetical protein